MSKKDREVLRGVSILCAALAMEDAPAVLIKSGGPVSLGGDWTVEGTLQMEGTPQVNFVKEAVVALEKIVDKVEKKKAAKKKKRKKKKKTARKRR